MSTLLDNPEVLGVVIRIGRSRAIAAGVDACQYDMISRSLRSAAEWTPAFLAAGEEHAARARKAEEENRLESASELFRLAAACFHIATTVPSPDRSGHMKASEAMASSNRCSKEDALHIRGDTFRGILVRRTSDAPLVIIVPGLDSSQVEFAFNAEAIRRRGLSTLTIDGPGQGELAPSTAPTPDYERVVSEAIDTLFAAGCQPRRIGLMALSLGGYYGARALAFEPRLSAGVTVSGPSRMIWRELPPLLQEILILRLGDRAKAEAFASEISIGEFVSRIYQPLLVIDGEDDVIPGFENGLQLAEAAQNGQYLSVPRGDHLVGNLRSEWLPVAADFLKAKLSV